MPLLICVALPACKKTKAFDDYAPPPIAAIAINPAGGTLSDGATVPVRADAWDADGNYVWLEDRSEVTVAWSVNLETAASTGVSFGLSTTTGNPTELTVNGQLPGPLKVSVTASWADAVPLQDDVLFNPATVIPPVADLVTVMPAQAPVMAMLDACERKDSGNTPVFALTYAFTGQVQLPRNLTGQSCARSTKYALLSPEYRMVVRDPPDLTGKQIWTDNLGDELKHAQPADWKIPDDIDLYLHYFVASPDQAEGQYLVNQANALLLQNSLGIRFVAIPPQSNGSKKNGNCLPAHLKGLLTEDGGDTADRLHVMFVHDIVDTGADGFGKTCAGYPVDGSRFILVHWSQRSGELLAHELGHALGHEYPNLAIDHVVDGLHDGFDKTNIMHENAGVAREWLTAGQTFRMNVDTGSWYQHEPKILPKHASRSCGDKMNDDDPCPKLNTRPGSAS